LFVENSRFTQITPSVIRWAIGCTGKPSVRKVTQFKLAPFQT
jgi:hypothetical protein